METITKKSSIGKWQAATTSRSASFVKLRNYLHNAHVLPDRPWPGRLTVGQWAFDAVNFLNMICWDYILISAKDKKLYDGMSRNLKKRLKQHNSGLVRSTKSRRPFELLRYFSRSRASATVA